jgi:hypothetical protein
VIEATTRASWRAEYLKRKFFVDQQSSKMAAEELPAYKALIKWRKKREERIAKGTLAQDCPLDRCHFNKPTPHSDSFPTYPFFYNTDCPECPFKTAIKETIIDIHNVKHPDQALASIAQIANGEGRLPWSREFTIIASHLHGLSYKYGLFAHDLFGLSNPEELLKGTPIRFCDTFIQQDKSVALEWIKVTNNPPPEVNITQNDIFELVKKYQLNIGVVLRAVDTNFDKATQAVKKQIRDFIKDPETQELPLPTDSIIFSFNPLHPAFLIKDATEIVRASIINYHATASGKPHILDAEYQDSARKRYEQDTHVKSYQDTGLKRAIGLYVWDKVHFENQPRNEVINALIENDLFELGMELSDEEMNYRNGIDLFRADQRKNDLPIDEKMRKGVQSNYDETYRLYEYANQCVLAGELLTGAECEKRMTKGRKPK